MLKFILIALLPLLVFFSTGSEDVLPGIDQKVQPDNTGILEKMIVANGSVTMDLDLNRINPARARTKTTLPAALNFDAERDSFFTVIVFNDELRGPSPGTMKLIPQNVAALPAKLNASYQDLVIESLLESGPFELAVRDGKTGFVFFNIEGHEYDFDGNQNLLNVKGGRLLLSEEFAAEIGRPSDAGSIVGQISLKATMRPIEVTHIVDGEIVSNELPAMNPLTGTVPGPDVVVGDLIGLAQFGTSSGTQVGLAVGTDSCNFGTVDLNWFANPNNDHPVIPQNLYRMSGGAANDERFEQIGQSSVKHGFTALTQNLCGLGCNGVGGTRLGSGCSDPYSASLNAGPNLGSRAWINPFTGAYPRNDSATPNNSHTGHTHTGPSHRILTEISDLSTTQNPGATYYAESQYVTPHEYAWCQANPTQCNMYNNVSYRRYNVSGTGSPFSFSPAAATVRAKTAISAWPGSTLVEIKPASGTDGVGTLAYKVTNPSPGVWHYEYAIFNENLDRSIQSFGMPLGSGVSLSNIGFRSPPQHPGWAADGTVGNAGYSNAPWTQTQTTASMTWSSETFAQNPNANAIRWGTMYNFRFDSNRPPQTVNATIGFYKTGAPITVQIKAPSGPATSVSVSGRVMTSSGRGVSGARVTIADSNGNLRVAVTGTFGYYTFLGMAAGGTYTISVAAKRNTFTPQTITINDNLTGVDFTAVP
ncbi:MAG: carboxypeptidase regulatory-like domain-containing protein [Pyrinomonadaceae bacterium]